MRSINFTISSFHRCVCKMKNCDWKCNENWCFWIFTIDVSIGKKLLDKKKRIFFYRKCSIVNIITSFLFFRSTFLTFFFRFVYHFVTILFCHFFVQSSLFRQYFNYFFFVLRSILIFNVVTTTKKWYLLFVIFFILTMISNYHFDYFEIFYSCQNLRFAFIIMR